MIGRLPDRSPADRSLAWQLVSQTRLYLRMVETKKECRYCNTMGAGNFCSACGQKFKTERLTLGLIFHEAFHFFTHLDHGFPYTLKRLLKSPGTMQKEYVDGVRLKYQKPFSMFFLCATVAAL